MLPQNHQKIVNAFFMEIAPVHFVAYFVLIKNKLLKKVIFTLNNHVSGQGCKTKPRNYQWSKNQVVSAIYIYVFSTLYLSFCLKRSLSCFDYKSTNNLTEANCLLYVFAFPFPNMKKVKK